MTKDDRRILEVSAALLALLGLAWLLTRSPVPVASRPVAGGSGNGGTGGGGSPVPSVGRPPAYPPLLSTGGAGNAGHSVSSDPLPPVIGPSPVSSTPTAKRPPSPVVSSDVTREPIVSVVASTPFIPVSPVPSGKVTIGRITPVASPASDPASFVVYIPPVKSVPDGRVIVGNPVVVPPAASNPASSPVSSPAQSVASNPASSVPDGNVIIGQVVTVPSTPAKSNPSSDIAASVESNPVSSVPDGKVIVGQPVEVPSVPNPIVSVAVISSPGSDVVTSEPAASVNPLATSNPDETALATNPGAFLAIQSIAASNPTITPSNDASVLPASSAVINAIIGSDSNADGGQDRDESAQSE